MASIASVRGVPRRAKVMNVCRVECSEWFVTPASTQAFRQSL
ncbi:MAG TPA: hypothetical protein VG937_00010 [Polyangiaceae bacterium]|nr:hypothetical protein [Polyangiaceae bacterium]